MIFQDSRKLEKCVGKVFLHKFSSYSLFFNISHCSIYLLCLGMICWLDLCIIEFIWNMFILFWFVRLTFHFLFLISFVVGEKSVISFSGLFIWSRLVWQAFLSVSLDFFRFLGSTRILWGSTSYLSLLRIPFCLVYRNFDYLCYVSVLFVDLCYFLCEFVFCFLFLWFLWFWVRTTWFGFGSILQWNVIFLFSSFPLMPVSLPTFYNRITLFFQVSRKQEKFIRKYFLSKFTSYSLCMLYRNFHYRCYVLVLFVDLCYFLCAFVFCFLFVISGILGEKNSSSFL